MQRLWYVVIVLRKHIPTYGCRDADFDKFNDRGEQISLMRNQYQQMKIHLESYEKTQAEMDDCARWVFPVIKTFGIVRCWVSISVYRLRIQALEAQLLQAQTSRHGSQLRHHASLEVATFAAEKSALMDANSRLRNENIELKDEVEEMRAMIEVLKGHHSGRRGLVSEPRASPVNFVWYGYFDYIKPINYIVLCCTQSFKIFLPRILPKVGLYLWARVLLYLDPNDLKTHPSTQTNI